MKVFHCDHCDHLVFFENTVCVNCEHRLAFLPEVLDMVSLEAVDEDQWRSPLARTGRQRYRLCRNYVETLVCNWAIAADDPNPLCESCRLTRVNRQDSQSGLASSSGTAQLQTSVST